MGLNLQPQTALNLEISDSIVGSKLHLESSSRHNTNGLFFTLWNAFPGVIIFFGTDEQSRDLNNVTHKNHH